MQNKETSVGTMVKRNKAKSDKLKADVDEFLSKPGNKIQRLEPGEGSGQTLTMSKTENAIRQEKRYAQSHPSSSEDE